MLLLFCVIEFQKEQRRFLRLLEASLAKTSPATYIDRPTIHRVLQEAFGSGTGVILSSAAVAALADLVFEEAQVGHAARCAWTNNGTDEPFEDVTTDHAQR
jgi:hypothetical protein